MNSESLKDRFSKVKSIMPNPLSFLQSSTIQEDGSHPTQSSRKPNPAKTLSRSSTSVAGLAEPPKSDHAAGPVSSLGNRSFTTQPRTTQTVNVVLFGETGVGKSSVINLIAQREVAKVSSDVNGCTMQSTRHDISFDDMTFSIFDTIGLEEPQMGVNGYLKAIEKAYELIVKLGAAGGIHLLLFCMRGGRITATTQSNYRLFCECLCSTKVPIALVFTGLEMELEMEDWWTRNKTHIEHYGIKSDGHACVTAVQDDTPGEDLKYVQSQKRIRELLKSCALKNEAFLPDPHSWFAKLGRGMRSFIEKHKNPKRRDVVKVLTHRCKLDLDTARKIAEMMEKGDGQDGDQDGNATISDAVVVGKDDAQPRSGEGEGGSPKADPVVRSDAQTRKDGKDRGEALETNAADDAQTKKHGEGEAETQKTNTGTVRKDEAWTRKCGEPALNMDAVGQGGVNSLSGSTTHW